ncbi:hypothetical protein CLV91_2208 [Maribacter vaceletii]|uniref:Uncharacterized protein n=1 Tax=Maribacter vaceletii TaxID=1206816 RepID=A0A495E987_9FLAO|nr:hypothetical protein [Maribacter vaceletii]RKR13488.1 hypothetical protein CLV91_2208 [Maribacter vaceletii]
MLKINSYEEFKETLKNKKPNQDWPGSLKSLWYDANDNWEASHNIAQDMHNKIGSWIHAYLHRKEGDTFNASYWYQQAGKTFPTLTLEEEHQFMVEFVLKK